MFGGFRDRIVRHETAAQVNRKGAWVVKLNEIVRIRVRPDGQPFVDDHIRGFTGVDRLVCRAR